MNTAITELDNEFTALIATKSWQKRVQEWHKENPTIAEALNLKSTRAQDYDCLLRFLINKYQNENDYYAGRLALQAMLTSVCKTLKGRSVDEDFIADFIADIWHQIKHLDLETVKFNIRTRIKHRAINLRKGRTKPQVQSVADENIDALGDHSGPASKQSEILTLLLEAQEHGVCNREEIQILAATYIDGETSKTLSKRFNKTPEAIRQINHRSLTKIRAHLVTEIP